MLKIFKSVVLGLSETYNHYPIEVKNKNIEFEPYYYELNKCEFREDFNKIYKLFLDEYKENSYEYYKNNWKSILLEYLENIERIDNELLNRMERAFFNRVVSFWDEMDINNENKWEKEIIDLSEEMRKCYETKNS